MIRLLLLAAAVLAAAGAWPAEPARGSLLRTSAAVFSRPHDLVLSPDAQYLYVADTGHDSIKVLDPRSLAAVGEIGRGELAAPHDVAFDAEGRLLVADTGNDRIAIYAVRGAEGQLVDELRGGLASPEGVSPWLQGSVLVTNAGLHNLVRFVQHKPQGSVGGQGSGRAQFDRPHDVAVNRAGQVFVADPGNRRVQVLDSGLRPVRSLGDDFFGFSEAKYLAFDEADRLYVADQDNNVVKVFSPQFSRLGLIGGAGELNRPEGVEARQGLVWVADTGNGRVLLYRVDLP